jgi:L-threonylcarbamoyladenylate synthase
VIADLPALRRALLAGRVAVVPTDTVYGLAAALDVPAGVGALYALKGRPRSQPCQVLLLGPALLDEAMAALDPLTRAAAAALLPGPVTCLVPDPAGRYAAAAGDARGTVGLRAPAPGPLAALGLPLVATSANEPGAPDPARLEEVSAALRRGAAVAVDGGTLPGTASAVVDLRALAGGGAAALLRPGADAGAVARLLRRAGARVETSSPGCTLEPSQPPEPGSGA